ncbi:MAG: beta-propeller fold lactonase family protein, partial [Ignavibacteriales bacterium]|nr:beta-propeller fold lactonase family protein [Ignavibacteriales bacterium]
TFSIFDVKTRKHFKTLKTGKTPRGIAWINDSTVAITLFGNGDLQVFNINTGKVIHTYQERGAMRDVRYDTTSKILYMGNMGTNLVYKYSWAEKKLLATEKVDSHPNTIKLTPDCKYLYVSCRGPNNPKGYVNRSPRNGEFSLIQTSDFKTLARWTAGNQPTGLDVSPNGAYLVATDFNDNMLNLYAISK